jgi:adenylate cyclase class IV
MGARATCSSTTQPHLRTTTGGCGCGSATWRAELTQEASRAEFGKTRCAHGAPGPIEELIAELGFRRIRKFVKLREVYVIGEFEISLDHLDGAGWFCEIEALTPDADIDAMAYDLGLRPRQLEPRTYSEIVDEMSAAGEPTPA